MQPHLAQSTFFAKSYPGLLNPGEMTRLTLPVRRKDEFTFSRSRAVEDLPGGQTKRDPPYAIVEIRTWSFRAEFRAAYAENRPRTSEAPKSLICGRPVNSRRRTTFACCGLRRPAAVLFASAPSDSLTASASDRNRSTSLVFGHLDAGCRVFLQLGHRIIAQLNIARKAGFDLRSAGRPAAIPAPPRLLVLKSPAVTPSVMSRIIRAISARVSSSMRRFPMRRWTWRRKLVVSFFHEEGRLVILVRWPSER